ncbi:hypothetical protein p9 [Pyrus virus A]|uniref:Uncharacterized protein n=1 Tax=Pyrus virus A TaxID=3139198 RepID=A0AAU6RX49_9CLOS
MESQVEIRDFKGSEDGKNIVFAITLFFGENFNVYYISNNKNFDGELKIITELKDHSYFLQLLQFFPFIKDKW